MPHQIPHVAPGAQSQLYSLQYFLLKKDMRAATIQLIVSANAPVYRELIHSMKTILNSTFMLKCINMLSL